MKKLFAILAVAVMVVVCASSCNKVAKTLAGTEWTATWSGDVDDANYNLSFNKTAFTLSMSFGSESRSITGTYSYTYPNVSMTANGDTMPATVSADYKTLTFEEGPTFTRKK